MADQAAIVQELYNRLPTLAPDKAAIVQELARRYGIGGGGLNNGPDAGARMRQDALMHASPELRGYTPAELDRPLNAPTPGGFGPAIPITTRQVEESDEGAGVRNLREGTVQIAAPTAGAVKLWIRSGRPAGCIRS
jgi:hypothetical protein